jgi:3-methyladenine DNA glycosylase AlkC
MSRIGARKMADIPADVLLKLNHGEIETLSMVEGLAVDLAVLLSKTIPEVDAKHLKAVENAKKEGWTVRTRLISSLLHKQFGRSIVPKLMTHPSDQVRGWAAGVIALSPGLTLKARLEHIKPLANDKHFGVRETAWLLLRDAIAEDIEKSIEHLKSWVNESTYLRRFAVEATRPCGVWCKHIKLLKSKPELGLPLLEPLKADPERYVQNSVANWLNDAAKSKPEWVKNLCKEWQSQSNSPSTLYIVKRAQRNL